MRVAIVTDLDLADWVGGGTLVNDYIAQRLRGAGHAVSFIKVNPALNGWDSADHAAIDLYFVANIPHLSSAQIQQLVTAGKPYVMFRHDIASVCYLDDPKQHPSAAIVALLFQHARANIFISSIQLAYYQRVCDIPRTLTMPPPLDVQAFHNQQRADRQGHLYLGEISAQRGITETLAAMQAQADGSARSFYGQVTEAAVLAEIAQAGAQHLDAIAHAAVADLLNRYRHFYYHPRIIDAFCLKVLEAELCGMELHVQQKNIGRYYYSASAPELAEFMRVHSVQMILDLVY